MPSNRSSDGDEVKVQIEPEKQNILVMDTKLKIIEILQVKHVLSYIQMHINMEKKCSKFIFFFSVL